MRRTTAITVLLVLSLTGFACQHRSARLEPPESDDLGLSVYLSGEVQIEGFVRDESTGLPVPHARLEFARLDQGEWVFPADGPTAGKDPDWGAVAINPETEASVHVGTSDRKGVIDQRYPIDWCYVLTRAEVGKGKAELDLLDDDERDAVVFNAVDEALSQQKTMFKVAIWIRKDGYAPQRVEHTLQSTASGDPMARVDLGMISLLPVGVDLEPAVANEDSGGE